MSPTAWLITVQNMLLCFRRKNINVILSKSFCTISRLNRHAIEVEYWSNSPTQIKHRSNPGQHPLTSGQRLPRNRISTTNRIVTIKQRAAQSEIAIGHQLAADLLELSIPLSFL